MTDEAGSNISLATMMVCAGQRHAREEGGRPSGQADLADARISALQSRLRWRANSSVARALSTLAIFLACMVMAACDRAETYRYIKQWWRSAA